MKEGGQWPRINIPKLVGRHIGYGCDSANDTGWQACDNSNPMNLRKGELVLHQSCHHRVTASFYRYQTYGT